MVENKRRAYINTEIRDGLCRDLDPTNEKQPVRTWDMRFPSRRHTSSQVGRTISRGPG